MEASLLIGLFATGLVALLGLFLVAFGLTACVRPAAAGAFLAGFAGSAFKHYAELAVRMAVGCALIFASPKLIGSTWIAGAGWVLLGTSGLMLVLPWELHRSFAQLAVPRTPLVLRAMGVASVGGGAFLLLALAGQTPSPRIGARLPDGGVLAVPEFPVGAALCGQQA